MKNLKDRFKSAQKLYQSEVNNGKPLESKIEKVASFLAPQENKEDIKRQKHYQRLREQTKESDYECDEISIKTKKSYNQQQQNPFQYTESLYQQNQEQNNNSNNNTVHMGENREHREKQDQMKNQQNYQQKQQNRDDYYQNMQKQKQQDTYSDDMTSQQQSSFKESDIGASKINSQEVNQNQQNQNQQVEKEEEEEGLSMTEKLRRRFTSPKLKEKIEEDYQKAYINTKASIPLMMTRSMKVSLLEMGYTPEQIRNLRPAEAHEILLNEAKNYKSPNSPPKK